MRQCLLHTQWQISLISCFKTDAQFKTQPGLGKLQNILRYALIYIGTSVVLVKFYYFAEINELTI